MSKKPSRLEEFGERARTLVNWRKPGSLLSLSRWRKFGHFWVAVYKSFEANRCFVRASALAYATALALIPMLAVAMSITSALLKQEGEAQIDKFITKLVASVTPPSAVSTNATSAATHPGAGKAHAEASDTNAPAATTNDLATAVSGTETNPSALSAAAETEQVVRARKEIAKSINEFIQNTQSGALGVTGTILLVFAAISMLSRIENTFNDIWGVAKGRSWFMRIVLYWGVISLMPLLLVVALGLASGPHFEGTREILSAVPFIGNLLFQVLPAVLLCLTFAAFYALIPNTKVPWSAALAGGLAGGLLFHLNNLVSVLYVSRVVSNSKIYGALGLVPVFMIGLYLAWLILLFGAQVACTYQAHDTNTEEEQIDNINQRGREFVALRMMACIGQRFVEGDRALTVGEISQSLSVPPRLVRKILQTLCSARLVTETSGEDPAYLPARPLENITCHHLLMALRATQGQELEQPDHAVNSEVLGEFHRIEEAERSAASSVTMHALVHRTQRPKEIKAS